MPKFPSSFSMPEPKARTAARLAFRTFPVFCTSNAGHSAFCSKNSSSPLPVTASGADAGPGASCRTSAANICTSAPFTSPAGHNCTRKRAIVPCSTRNFTDAEDSFRGSDSNLSNLPASSGAHSAINAAPSAVAFAPNKRSAARLARTMPALASTSKTPQLAWDKPNGMLPISAPAGGRGDGRASLDGGA